MENLEYRDASLTKGFAMGRRPLGEAAMTDAERQQRRRDRAKALCEAAPNPATPRVQNAPVQLACAPSPTVVDLLALDAETIATRIFNAVSADKVASSIAALQRWLWQGKPRFS